MRKAFCLQGGMCYDRVRSGGRKFLQKNFHLGIDFCGRISYNRYSNRERRVEMTPRTGRPTDDPKRGSLHMRLSETDLAKLEYCARETGLTRAEIVRKGIDLVYDQLTSTETRKED